MVKAVGSGSTLRIKGVGNDVTVYLGSDPSVSDDGMSVPITGSYGTVTRFRATDLTGSGVTVFGTNDRTVAYLSQQDDLYLGGAAVDRIFANGGDDQLFGGGGNDYVRGGEGNDMLSGNDGKDRLFGEDGNDEIFGGPGVDKLYGGDGNDFLSGGDDNDRLFGEAGLDVIDGGPGVDVAYYSGNASDYSISIVDGNYRIADLRLESPDDVDFLGNVERLHFADRNMGLAPIASNLSATIGADGETLIVSGMAAYDDPDHRVTIYADGFPSNDFQPLVFDNGRVGIEVPVEGTLAYGYVLALDATGVTGAGVSVVGVELAYLSEQNDVFMGDGQSAMPNTVHGNGGDDMIWGGEDADELFGDAGNDYLDGDSPTVDPLSLSAFDILHGGTGDDVLFGNVGNDELYGDEGDDILEGGFDNDYLDGGADFDVAVFSGNRADYSVSFSGDTLIVRSLGMTMGVDRLVNIEVLRFDDGDVSVASLGQAEPAAFEQVPAPAMEQPVYTPIDLASIDMTLIHLA